jgi:hypothetical protein
LIAAHGSLPSVATLQTVLREPTAGQRAVLSELVARTDAMVVIDLLDGLGGKSRRRQSQRLAPPEPLKPRHGRVRRTPRAQGPEVP